MIAKEEGKQVAVAAVAPGREEPIAPSAEIRRGAWVNALAILASNFRGVFTFLVARLLGPAALGTFSVAWAATDFLSKIGIFGLDNAIVPFIARAEAAGDNARSRRLALTAIVLVLAQCSLVALIAIAAVQLLGRHLALDERIIAAVSVLLCAMPGVGLYRVSTAISRGMKVMRHDIYSRGITETVSTTLVFGFLFWIGYTTHAPQLAVIAGTAASALVAITAAMSLFRAAPKPFQPGSALNGAGQLLRYAAPISIYDLLNSFIMRVDVIMLACFIGRAPGVTLPVVGIYGAAVEVAGGLRKANQAFNPILGPVLAGLLERGEKDQAVDVFSRAAQWILWVLVPLVAVLALAGSTILAIYGPAFREGAPWLTIIGVACATNAFVALAETTIMVQRPHANLWNSLITCAVAIGANLWLIANFGAMGAAFGILVPYVVQGLLRYRTLRFDLAWRSPFRGVSPPLLAGLLALLPAGVCRLLIEGIAGEVASAVLFLALYLGAWLFYRRRNPPLRLSSATAAGA